MRQHRRISTDKETSYMSRIVKIDENGCEAHPYACTVCGTILYVALRAEVPYCSLDSSAAACVHCSQLSAWLVRQRKFLEQPQRPRGC